MNKSSQLIRSKLLAILTDNAFHSGEMLGKTLGISRAAISNHIKVLTSLGLDIYSLTGKGYRLAQPISLLDLAKIEQYLPAEQNVKIEVLNVIGSTNQYLKEKIAEISNGHICLAEAQTAGRGRHGRKWVSPFASSLYLSMYWSFAGGYGAIGGLSLVIGVAVANALRKSGIDEIQLKWPNDIYAQGKKLAGVLIEAEGQTGSACHTVIGVGLNVCLPKSVEEITQPWIDLAELSEQPLERNHLASQLITELTASLKMFEDKGLAAFIETWRKLDIYADQPVKLIIGQQNVSGISRGIDNGGAILLETKQGIRAYHGGEISVRPI